MAKEPFNPKLSACLSIQFENTGPGRVTLMWYPTMTSKITNKTHISSKISLVLIGFIIALLLFEVGLRTFKWLVDNSRDTIVHNINNLPQNDAYEKEGEYSRKYDRFALMRFSSFLGYSPVENHKGRGYMSNQYGFRYKEDFPIKKPRGEIRIFVTGGSTAWGSGTSQEDIFTTLVERELQTHFQKLKIRVISAGVGAYLSTHERILIVNTIKDFEPDIIVMFSGWNDTYAGYRGNRVTDDNWDYLGAAPILAKHNPRYSLGNQKIKKKIDPPRYDEYRLKTHYSIDRFLYGLRTRNQIEQSISDIQIEPEVILDDLEGNIKVIVDVSKRNNFVFMFYLQPSLYNSQKELSAFEAYLTEKGATNYIGFPDYNSQLYELYRKLLPLLANREEFIFIDGDDAISHEKRTVFDDHVHFGDRGNRLIAQHLVEITSDLLKGSYNYVSAEQGVALERDSATLHPRQ